MKVNREELLRKLENASIAVTSSAILEQSNSFVFCKGDLLTFDGEIFTRQESPFGKEIEGAIVADDFLKIVQRFPDDTLEINVVDKELIIKGKRRSAGIRMYEKVLLPYEEIPLPSKLYNIHEDLQIICLQAAQICGKDETSPKTTHVHITKDRVEATDGFRVLRGEIDTKVKEELMVHAITLASAFKHQIKKIGTSKNEWLHLITYQSMTISLLCSEDAYYEKKMIDELLDITGEEVKFPKNLSEILARAEIMDTPSLSIGGWDSQVTISLRDDLLKVTARKEEGWFKETKKIKYQGRPFTFTIHPSFLKEIIKRTRKVLVNDRQIKVETDNIQFTAALEAGGK